MTTTVFAQAVKNTSTVDFPPGQKNGYFYCTTSEDSATVNINTSNLDAKGFCGGPYVQRPGHITGLPAKTLNEVYFAIQKSAFVKGSVTVNVSSGTLTCTSGQPSRSEYEPDAAFCALPPQA